MSRPSAYLQSDCRCRVQCQQCPRLRFTHEDNGSTSIECGCEDPCRLNISFYPCDPDQSDESSDEPDASGNDSHDKLRRPRSTPNDRKPGRHRGRTRDRRGTPPKVGSPGFTGRSESQAESSGAKDRGEATHRVSKDPLPGPSNQRRPSRSESPSPGPSNRLRSYRSKALNGFEENEEAESLEGDTGRKRRRNKGKRRGNRKESAHSKKPNMQGRCG